MLCDIFKKDFLFRIGCLGPGNQGQQDNHQGRNGHTDVEALFAAEKNPRDVLRGRRWPVTTR